MPREIDGMEEYLTKKSKSKPDFELNLKTFGSDGKSSRKKNTPIFEDEEDDNIEMINVEERDKKGSILKKVMLMFQKNKHKDDEFEDLEDSSDEIKLYDNYEKVFEDTKKLLRKVFKQISTKELEKLKKTSEFKELAEIYFDQW